MKRLILLRHGKAAPPRGSGDFSRTLAERGQMASAAIGRYLRQENLLPDVVLVSAAARTRETYVRVAAAAGALPVPKHEDDLYLAPVATLFAHIRRTSARISTLMMVGHNPGLAELVQILADHDESDMAGVMAAAGKFPTAALAVFNILTPWSETGPGDGALARFITPQLLGGIDED